MSGDKDSEQEEVSLHDEIRAAFNDANAKSEDGEVDNEGVVDKLQDKPRDETGKFAKKDEDKPEEEGASKEEAKKPKEEAEKAPATEPEGEKPNTEVSLDNEKAPTSWSPSVREKWGALPGDVRAEIIRREAASATGVRRLHEEYAPIKQFTEALTPIIQEANQQGQNPAQYISNVMASERGLRNPDPKQRFAVLLNIAEQYGIPLRDIVNQSAGSEVIPALQQPQYAQLDPKVQQELEQLRASQQTIQQESLRSEVERFKADKEFFDDVSAIMANLIDSGTAKDLGDAYDQACWINPEVRKVLLEREKTGKAQSDLKQRQAAASKASVKASGQADITVKDGEDESLEDTVRNAIIEASGRV